MSGLIGKIGKALDKGTEVFTEHFFGIETSNYYRDQRTLLKQTESLRDIGNPKHHKYIKRELWWRGFEAVSMKICLTALQYLGIWTLFHQPFNGDPKAGMRAIWGLAALAIPEITRNFYVNPSIKKVREETMEEVKTYMKSLKTSDSSLVYAPS